jgi:hypothetical protein
VCFLVTRAISNVMFVVSYVVHVKYTMRGMVSVIRIVGYRLNVFFVSCLERSVSLSNRHFAYTTLLSDLLGFPSSVLRFRLVFYVLEAIFLSASQKICATKSFFTDVSESGPVLFGIYFVIEKFLCFFVREVLCVVLIDCG